jgi:hypothetical protein
MILLQSCLLISFWKSVLFPLSRMEMPRSDATRRIHHGQHFQILVDGGNPEANRCKPPVSCRSSLFGGDFYHTGCTSRTVLCGFGSVFQNVKLSISVG